MLKNNLKSEITWQLHKRLAILVLSNRPHESITRRTHAYYGLAANYRGLTICPQTRDIKRSGTLVNEGLET